MRDFWKLVEVIAGSRRWRKCEPLDALAFVQLFRALQASLFCWKNLKIITDYRLVPFLSNALDTRQSRLSFCEKRYQHLFSRRLRRIVCMPRSASWLRLHGASCVLRRPRCRPRFDTSHLPRSRSPNRGIVTPVVLRYVPKRLQIVMVCCGSPEAISVHSRLGCAEWKSVHMPGCNRCTISIMPACNQTNFHCSNTRMAGGVVVSNREPRLLQPKNSMSVQPCRQQREMDFISR
jgi:hypothetical protein